MQQEIRITTKSLISHWKSLKRQKQVLGFYSHNSDFFPYFSNFYIQKPFTFKIPKWCGIMSNDTVQVEYSEKAIMLCKASLMGDIETYQNIKVSTNPTKTKKLGRLVTPWNQEVWDNNVCYIAKEVIYSKFSQNRLEIQNSHHNDTPPHSKSFFFSGLCTTVFNVHKIQKLLKGSQGLLWVGT